MVHGKLRSGLRQVHLWITWIFGILLVLAGLTGVPLAWLEELDAALNPQLFHVAPPSGVAAGGAARWQGAQVQQALDALGADPRYGRPDSVALPAEAGHAWMFTYRIKRDPDALLTNDRSRQVMWDPYAMRATGERVWGETGLSPPLLMPTLFVLHRYLLLGETGKVVMGVTGLALLITSLAGLALWWPKATWSSLQKALTVRVGGSSTAFNYSLHRAAGFFAVPVLAVLGFSGWYFNLSTWVTPIVGAVAAMAPPDKPKNAARPAGAEAIGVAQAMAVAQARFPHARLSRITLPAGGKAPYEVRLRQPDEVRKGSGSTRVSIDAYQGTVLKVRDPLTAAPGDRFLGWQFPLHTGEAFGVPGRILITIAGFTPLLFAVTGVLMWWRRRQPRPAARQAVAPKPEGRGAPVPAEAPLAESAARASAG